MEFNFLIVNIISGINLYLVNERVLLIFSFYIIIIIVVFILLVIVIIVGNLLVFVFICFNFCLWSLECILILFLLVVDLMVGLFLFLVKIVELMFFYWVRKFMWCDMIIFLIFFVLSVCLMNFVIVVFDRCLVIFYILRYNSFMMVLKVCFGIVMVWLIVFIVVFLLLLGVGIKLVKI